MEWRARFSLGRFAFRTRRRVTGWPSVGRQESPVMKEEAPSPLSIGLSPRPGA
jgi:hypothetical protein